ncbi:MAG: hypothetical protein HY585_00565 [Candidatus Omnitrophica bacterium]|nr:hypothetical protein [Candidatus Omnitrophota bacterium]
MGQSPLSAPSEADSMKAEEWRASMNQLESRLRSLLERLNQFDSEIIQIQRLQADGRTLLAALHSELNANRVEAARAFIEDLLNKGWTSEKADPNITIENLMRGIDEVQTNIKKAKEIVWLSEDPSYISPDQLVSWMTIGWSDIQAVNRNVGWAIKKIGWKGFIEKYIKPQIDWGVRRIVLHNPFGTLPGEIMQLDQLLHAKESGLTWLYEGFAEAWRPYTSGEYGGPPIEVIAYVGYADGDRDFKILRRGPDPNAWEDRAWQSLQPILDAGMSVALDVGGGTHSKENSMTYQLAVMLRAQAVKVYIEPNPPAAYTHWHDFSVITFNKLWKRMRPDTNPYRAGKGKLMGETIRFFDYTNQDLPRGEKKENFNTWGISKIRDIMRQGHTVAISLGTISKHLTMQDLLGNNLGWKKRRPLLQNKVAPPEEPHRSFLWDNAVADKYSRFTNQSRQNQFYRFLKPFYWMLELGSQRRKAKSKSRIFIHPA